MKATMSKVQDEARLSEKTVQKIAKRPISVAELVQIVDNDPPKAGNRRRTYTLSNPPPHLRSIPKAMLVKAFEWAQGDWFLLEPLPNGVMVHNNRDMAMRYRKTHKK